MITIPQGLVTLSDRRSQRSWPVEPASFQLAAFPVTQAQYAQITGQRPSTPDGDRLPVEGVSWRDTFRSATPPLNPRDSRPPTTSTPDIYDAEVYTNRVPCSGGLFDEHGSCRASVLPDHDRLLEQIAGRLTACSAGTVSARVCDAVRLVLLHNIDEGDLARCRYALTSTVSPDMGEPAPLRAELMPPQSSPPTTTCCVADCAAKAPARELDDALRLVIGLFTASGQTPDGTGTGIVAFRAGQDIGALIPALQRLADERSGTWHKRDRTFVTRTRARA